MLLAIPELTNYIIPFEVSKGCLYKLKRDDLDVCYVYIDRYVLSIKENEHMIWRKDVNEYDQKRERVRSF